MSEGRQGHYTREDGEISIRIHSCEYMQYITIADTDWIVPIVRTESIFDVDYILVLLEIIVDNSPSSIDNTELAIGNIDPCLSSPDIRHIPRDEEYIRSIPIVLSIGHHRIVIWEDHDRRSALSIGIYECWSDDVVLDDVYLPESYLWYSFDFFFYLFIVLPLQTCEYRSREEYSEYTVDRDHKSGRDPSDHIDLVGCEEYLVCYDPIHCFDSRICLTRFIYWVLSIYLCYDPMLYLVPIGDLHNLTDLQLTDRDISSTIEEWRDTDRVLERDDRGKK